MRATTAALPGESFDDVAERTLGDARFGNLIRLLNPEGATGTSNAMVIKLPSKQEREAFCLVWRIPTCIDAVARGTDSKRKWARFSKTMRPVSDDDVVAVARRLRAQGFSGDRVASRLSLLVGARQTLTAVKALSKDPELAEVAASLERLGLRQAFLDLKQALDLTVSQGGVNGLVSAARWAPNEVAELFRKILVNDETASKWTRVLAGESDRTSLTTVVDEICAHAKKLASSLTSNAHMPIERQPHAAFKACSVLVERLSELTPRTLTQFAFGASPATGYGSTLAGNHATSTTTVLSLADNAFLAKKKADEALVENLAQVVVKTMSCDVVLRRVVTASTVLMREYFYRTRPPSADEYEHARRTLPDDVVNSCGEVRRAPFVVPSGRDFLSASTTMLIAHAFVVARIVDERDEATDLLAGSLKFLGPRIAAKIIDLCRREAKAGPSEKASVYIHKAIRA